MADERLDFEPDSPWRGEHYFRYAEILKYIEPNHVVLDIACGSGYGTYQIAGKTKENVFGGDISNDAVAKCNETWDRPNLKYRVLDGTALDFPDEYFDRVISFETIEHTTEYPSMLKELNRVLKQDGTAFISTPNILINSPSGVVTNPFHTQEFELHELRQILDVAFKSFEIFGQKYSRHDATPSVSLGKMVETIFTQRVIRRTPTSVKNQISNFVNGKPFYPQVNDFSLVSSDEDIKKCQTFFCVCRK